MQTLHAGYSKAEPKIFAPMQTPLTGVQDGQNLISWRWSPPSPTDPVWWGSMHAISSYHGNRPTNTHKQTGPIIICCTAKLSTQCSKTNSQVHGHPRKHSRKFQMNYLHYTSSKVIVYHPCYMAVNLDGMEQLREKYLFMLLERVITRYNIAAACYQCHI